MKVNKLLLSTWRQIMSHKGLFFLSTFLITISLLVIEYQAIFLGGSIYQSYMAHKLIKAPKRTYFLDFTKYLISIREDTEKLTKFEIELGEMEGVQYSGVYLSNYDIGGPIQISPIYMSHDLIAMCDLKNEEGEDVVFPESVMERNLGMDRHQTTTERSGMLVGYGLKDMFPKGYLYTDEVTGEKFIVTDILEPDSKWIKDRMSAMDIYQDLDYALIFNGDFLLKQQDSMMISGGSAFCLVLEEGADKELVKKAVFELAENCGLDLYSMKSVTEKLEQNRQSLFDEPMWVYMPIAILLMALSAVIVSSSIAVILRKSSIGVMYAIGYSTKDIQCMVLMENALKVFFAFGVAYGFWRVSEMNLLEGISIIQFMLPGLIAGVLVMILVGSLIPIWLIRHMSPAELIGGREA